MIDSLPTGYKIILPDSPSEWEAYYQLRYEVLRKPWNQELSSTRDEWEDKSVHFLVLDDTGQAVGTGRLQLNSEREGQIRSMAVHENFRGKGIGNFLIQKLEEESTKRGLKSIVLDAREEALNFYLRNNYVLIEDSYLLFGVIKHFKMKKNL